MYAQRIVLLPFKSLTTYAHWDYWGAGRGLIFFPGGVMYAKKYVKVLAQNIGLFDTDINVPPSPSDGLQITRGFLLPLSFRRVLTVDIGP